MGCGPLWSREHVNVVAIEDSTDERRMLFYGIHVLPFGTQGKCGSIQWVCIGHPAALGKGLLLPHSNFYDDFELMSKAVDLAVKTVSGLTRWRWKGGHKDPEFSAVIRRTCWEVGA